MNSTRNHAMRARVCHHDDTQHHRKGNGNKEQHAQPSTLSRNHARVLMLLLLQLLLLLLLQLVLLCQLVVHGSAHHTHRPCCVR